MERDPGNIQNKDQTTTQRRDENRERASLDACYGRIGIPAVAAALTPRHDERRPANDRRFKPYDRD